MKKLLLQNCSLINSYEKLNEIKELFQNKHEHIRNILLFYDSGFFTPFFSQLL